MAPLETRSQMALNLLVVAEPARSVRSRRVDRDNQAAVVDLRVIATKLIQHYDWHWVQPAALVAQAQNAAADSLGAASGEGAHIIEQAASGILFSGCQDPATREAAYQDLTSYLRKWTRHLAPPAPGVLWEDLLQETLRTIVEGRVPCQDPTAFLHWAVVILKRAAAGTWRSPRPAQLDMPGVEEPAAPLATTDPAGDQELLRLLHDCLDTDEERTWALAVFFAGLKRREWALLFDTPIERYDTLGQQVKRKLRRSVRFRAFFGKDRNAHRH